MTSLVPNKTFKMIVFISFVVSLSIALDCKPFGVRLNLGLHFIHESEPDKLSIRFDTHLSCQKSYVTVIKQGSSIKKLYCNNTVLTFDNYTSYVHRCSIVDLDQGNNISYMVFGWTGGSDDPQIPYVDTPISYTFPKKNEEFKMVSLADWSYLRQMRTRYRPLDDSFDYLVKTDNSIKAIFINGDVAYDLQSNNGRNYQDFLNMIAQVTTRWPLIINPGNHEHRDNNMYILNTSFETYSLPKNRVVLIKLPMFNFILFDPYQILYDKEPQNKSYGAFRAVLDKSYQSKMLTITGSHYPFRCNGEVKDCETKHEQMSSFFKAMFQVNIPLYLGAHYHAYERHYPFKVDGTFVNNSQTQWNPDLKDADRRLISVVEGAAGNDIAMSQAPSRDIQNFTAASSYNMTGYAIINIGQTRLTYSHYNSSNFLRPFDTFEIMLRRSPKMQLRSE